MDLLDLNINIDNTHSKSLIRKLNKLNSLISELKERNLPEEIIKEFNTEIEKLNSSPLKGKKLGRLISKSKMYILQTLDKKLKIVPKNAYRGRWLAIGMIVFGIPMGTAYGVAMGNMGFVGVGIPIGMVIGMAIGSRMDKKAAKEGRQLKFEASEV